MHYVPIQCKATNRHDTTAYQNYKTATGNYPGAFPGQLMWFMISFCGLYHLMRLNVCYNLN